MLFRKGQLGTVSIRTTIDGRKMARIMYWDDIAGQHARKRVTTKWRDVTEWKDEQVQLWRMQVIADAGVYDPKKPIPSTVNFEAHADDWLNTNLPRYKRSCRDTVEMLTRSYLIPAFGKLGLEAITGPAVNVWIGTVRLRDGRMPSKRTLKHLVVTLQVVLGRIFAKRDIKYPADARPKKKIYCPTDCQIAQIVAESEGVYKMLFAMAASTGMRCGELYGLLTEDIDFERCSILVRRSFCRGEVNSVKTDNSWRHITIHPDLIEMIRQYKGDRTSGTLLLSTEDTPLHSSNVLHRQLHRILRKLGIQQFGMHSFRHYSVSYCVRAGMSFDDVRMRHGQGTDEVMRMYLHLAPGHDARTLRMIPNVTGVVGTSDGTSTNVEPIRKTA